MRCRIENKKHKIPQKEEQLKGKKIKKNRKGKGSRCRAIPSLKLQRLEQQSGHGVPNWLLCAHRTNVRHDLFIRANKKEPLPWNTTPPLTQEGSARPWALLLLAVVFRPVFIGQSYARKPYFSFPFLPLLFLIFTVALTPLPLFFFILIFILLKSKLCQRSLYFWYFINWASLLSFC